MKSSDERIGKQQGDPVRGYEAIITAVESETPHLRLILVRWLIQELHYVG